MVSGAVPIFAKCPVFSLPYPATRTKFCSLARATALLRACLSFLMAKSGSIHHVGVCNVCARKSQLGCFGKFFTFAKREWFKMDCAGESVVQAAVIVDDFIRNP